MGNIKLDIPDITVVVEKGNEYLSSVQPSEIYQILVNTGDNYNVVVDDPAIITANGSGSYLTVADYASTSSYALYAQSIVAGGAVVYDTISASNAYFGNLVVSQSITANLFSGSFSGDGSQLTGIGVSGGTNQYIPLWTGTSTLSSSLLFQTGSSLLLGSTVHHTPEAPDRFGVYTGVTDSYNAISVHGTTDNYFQLNIKNFSEGANASADIVATTDSGTELYGYINMGINGTGYVGGGDSIGTADDGYLYMAGDGDLLIGNASTNRRIILFSGAGSAINNARVFIDTQGFVGINTSSPVSDAPEALAVQAIPESFNVINARASTNSYAQFNIKNSSNGVDASSDIVATADNGTETSNYINMGINSSQFAGLIGGPNDAYLYSTGSMLHIGNATPNQHVMFFAGSGDVEESRKLTLEANNLHTLTGSLDISGSISTLSGIINNLTASFAMTASYVSGAASSWDTLANKPVGLVSSSIQINTGSFSGSFTGILIGTGSWANNAISASYAPTILPNGTISSSGQVDYSQLQNIPANIVSSSAQASTWAVASSSVATSASYAPTILPNGTVSSSTQVDYNSIQNQPTTIPTASYVLNSVSASYALTASYVSGAASDWDSVANKPSGLVSSSTQINTGSFSGSFIGGLLGTSSWANNAISSSYAPTILPIGTISSSAQVQLNQLVGTTFSASNFTFPQNLTVNGTLVAQEFITEYVSSSVIYESGSTKFGDTLDDTHQFTGSVLISGSGVVIGSFTASAISAPITGSLLGTASFATTASAATSITFTPATASFAPTASFVEYINIANKPTLISSSAQINTGSFSGSFVGELLGTSSWATSASYVSPSGLPTGTVSSSTQVSYTSLQNIPVGIISSSTQLPSGTVSSSVQINTGSFSGSFVGTLTGTGSWASNAISASYAPTILPTGIVSSSTQVDYSQLQNIPIGIVSSSAQVTTLLPVGTVSSSTQINTGSFSGSFVGELIGTSSWASNAISSSFATTASAATSITFVPPTASFATTASYAANVILPSGLVSSSVQINTGSFTGSFVGGHTGSLLGTSSWAVSSSYVDPSGLPTGIVSSSAQVTYSQLQNIPIGIVSSSAQINTGSFSGSFVGSLLGTSSWASNAVSASYAPTILPVGTISSSAQVDYNSIQNQPTTIPTASYVLNAISSSFALTASYVSGAASSWETIANKPSGLVSSSVQINTGSFSGSFTGTLIGTSSWASNAISSSFATTSSAATSITFTPETASFSTTASAATSITFVPLTASFATTASYAANVILPSGLVSSSVQINTGSFTGSFVGGHTGSLFGTSSWAQSSSVAISASYAPTILPSGTVSSSAQINTGSFSGSFTGTLLGTASWATFAETSSNIIGGTAGYIPQWTDATTLSSSVLFQTASSVLLGAITQHTPEAPDTLGIYAGNTTSYNAISVHGTTDNYFQLNIKNFSSESYASSDIVATADTGTEVGGFIDMGINNSNYNTGNAIGNPLDAYLFNTGSDLLIGNISPNKRIILFNGAGPALDNARVYIDSIGTVAINTGSATPGNPEALLVKAIAYSYNMITAQADINNYAQVNIFNKNNGNFASSDFVATADNGDETGYYIDMGINSSTFDGSVGSVNDGYLYTTGSDLYVGNASPDKRVILFSGDTGTSTSTKLIIDSADQHQLTGSLTVTGSIRVVPNVVNQLTASNAISSSYVVSASYAPTILPPNIVSSSSQINTGSFTGSFVGTLTGTATNAITASYALNGTQASTAVTIDTYTFDADGSTVNYLVSQSYNSSSLFISVNGLTYINPTDYTIASNTITFVTAPISESYIVIRALTNATAGATGSFYGSFFGSIESSSFANTASFAVSASWAPNAGGSNNWNDLINVPSGLISSSAQASTWTVASSSVAISASYAPLILPDGVVSSSAQASTWTVATASVAISASWAPSVAGTMVPIQDEGTEVVSTAIALNFIGAGVTVTNTSNTASITIPGGSGGDVAAKIVSASYSFGSSNEFIFTSGSFTVTLPSAVGVIGREYQIKNISTGMIFITGSHTIDDYSDITITEKNTALGLISNGINWSIF